MAGDPAAALPLIASAGIDEDNYLRLAAEADIHGRLGFAQQAAQLYARAAAVAPTEPERRFLSGKSHGLG